MIKRFACALAALLLLLSSFGMNALAEDTANPLLADWSRPAYTYSTKGRRSAENGYQLPADQAGQVMWVTSAAGEWTQLTALEAGDYSFSVDTDQLAGDSLTFTVWRYRDREGNNDLKKTDTLRFGSGQGVVTQVIHDVYESEILYWQLSDNGGNQAFLFMVSPGNCSQAKQEITWEIEEGLFSPLAPDDGLNGQPIITRTPRTGDTILMGWYEQDNNFDNGRERIEWTVLDVNESKDELLVISKMALDCILYHPSRISVKWVDSAIRNWLNFDFAMASLSSGELDCIVPQKVATDWDTVTMLDEKQIKKYKLDSNGCLVSEYAANKELPVNVAENGRGCWWVREDQTRSGGWTSFVGRHGKVYGSNYTTSADNGVRPAMKLSISALKNCRLGPDFIVLLGEVVDASNPSRKLSGTHIAVNGRSLTTDQHGRFVLDADPGDYAYRATRSDYITAEGTFTVRAGRSNVFTVPMCRKMAENEYRVVLTWGLNPADLDSHLNGRTENGSSYHVFYVQLRQDGGKALLEWDDIDSFGPETTHFFAYPGSDYTFSVHDYTNRASGSSDRMARSGARVVVYHADAELASFSVPDGAGTVWDVFTVRDGQMYPINQMSFCSDPRQVR